MLKRKPWDAIDGLQAIAAKERSLRLVSQIKHSLPVWAWWAVIACTTGTAWSQPQGQQLTGRTSWWLPENVFEPGNQIDLLFNIILWMTGIVCVAVFAVMAVFLIRYRLCPRSIDDHSYPNR